MISYKLLERVVAFEHEYDSLHSCDVITVHIKNDKEKRWWNFGYQELKTIKLRYTRMGMGRDAYDPSKPCSDFLQLLQNTLLYQEPTVH